MTPAPRTLPRRTVLAVSGTAVLAAAAACSSTTAAAPPRPQVRRAPSVGELGEGRRHLRRQLGKVRRLVRGELGQGSRSPRLSPRLRAVSCAARRPAPSSRRSPTSTAAGSVVVNAPSGPVLLASDGGTVVCHTAICTHQGCTVAASGACPCHGSKFNVTTGAVESRPGPAAARRGRGHRLRRSGLRDLTGATCTGVQRPAALRLPIAGRLSAGPPESDRTASAQLRPRRSTQQAPRISSYEHQ